MKNKRVFAALTLLLATVAAGGEGLNWPAWRGDGSGFCGDKNTPLYWSVETGMAWKTSLPGAGHSSPVVLGDRVFLTASTEAGTNRIVLCLDRNDGKIIWRTDILAPRAPKTGAKNGYASATPATDGERVYAFFDSPGLMALDMDGNPVWTQDLGPFKNDDNMASSPVRCGDLVIQCCDQDEGSFIAAFDRKTGDERWRKPRPEMSRQWSTPLLADVDGKPQVIVNGETVIAYDPASGREIWRCRGMRPNVTPSAVALGGLVYAVSGRSGPAMAIDPRGSGDVTETHIRMQISSGGPYVPSPLALSAGLFLPGDDGRARLIGADGSVLFQLRIPGHYIASPVAAGDLVYWPDEQGRVAVMRVTGEPAAPKLELVAVNPVGGACLASPAIAGGKLFIRTDSALLCIVGTEKLGQAEPAELPDTFAELRKIYTEHPETNGPDAALRIAVVEKLGTLATQESVALLRQAALKDPQWDVGEAAAKSLAAIGRPAVPALIDLMGAVDYQPYLKTIAADALGALDAVEAVPALLKGSADNNPLVRLPSLQALGRIAAADTKQAERILPALNTGLADPEGTVRKTAVEAMTRYAVAAPEGAERDAAVAKLRQAASDKNPLVAAAAAAALKLASKAQPQPPPPGAAAPAPGSSARRL